MMTSFVASSHSLEHSGLVRMHRAAVFLQATAAQGLPQAARLQAGLRTLAGLAQRSAATLRAGHHDWVQSRNQAAEDEHTWNAALKDARIMAELSRAMQGQNR